MRGFGKTDRGLCREINQDSFSFCQISDTLCYAVLCDGMGGENGGNVASELTVRDIGRELSAALGSDAEQKDLRTIMEQAISHANLVVNRAARDTEALRGMGTTVVLAVAEGSTVTIAHAGDSRAYLIHGEELSQLTHDHTVVQMLMERGEITEEEALSHPQRHYITRAVGVDCEIRVEFSQVELGEGDAVLLCSDGLYNYADPTDFPRLVREALESGDASGFIDAANAGGGGDNITAVILSGDAKEKIDG